MKNVFKKTVPLLFTLLTLSPFLAAAKGGAGPGGGDPCEDRIQVIRDDIKKWINDGGANSLNLPDDITIDAYKKLMLENIKAAKLRCVKPGDKGHPVAVNEVPKVCRFDTNIGKTQAELITCDYDIFLNQTDESLQYNLIHHEYAGLAGVEKTAQKASNYKVSNQVSAFLETRLMKSLSIKPKRPNLGPLEAKVGKCEILDKLTGEVANLPLAGMMSSSDPFDSIVLRKRAGSLIVEATQQYDGRYYVRAVSLENGKRHTMGIGFKVDTSGSKFTLQGPEHFENERAQIKCEAKAFLMQDDYDEYF